MIVCYHHSYKVAQQALILAVQKKSLFARRLQTGVD